LVDAVGVDPVEEMIYFWNGLSRMAPEQLEDSLENLAWSESDANKSWHRESQDERAILAFLRSAVLRSLRRHDEAKEILQDQILSHDKASFKGHLKDEWTCPAAHYEMAVNLWMERSAYITRHGPAVPKSVKEAPSRPTSSKSKSSTGSRLSTATPRGTPPMDNGNKETAETHDRRKVGECKEWLDKVAKWEGYELDTRIGLKVTAAEETIRRWEASNPPSSVQQP
jgi:hypothetical protein